MASLLDRIGDAPIADASSDELRSAVEAIASASSDAYTEWARRTLQIAVHDCYRLSGGGGDDRGVVAARAIDASPSQPVELVVVPFDAMLHATAALVCNSQAEAAAAKAFAAVANKLTREVDVLACRRPAGTATSPAATKSATRRVEAMAFCGGSSAPKPAWPGAAVAAAPRNIARWARLPKGAKFGFVSKPLVGAGVCVGAQLA